jgi:hypothetical protein
MVNVKTSFALQELKGFCFKNDQETNQFTREIKTFLLPQDRLQKKGSERCVELVIDAARSELIDKFVYANFQVDQTYGGSQSVGQNKFDHRQCRMTIDMIENQSSKQLALDVDHKKFKANAINQQKEFTSQQMLILSHEKQGSIQVNNQKTMILCRVLPNGYEIEISLEGESGGISTALFIKGDQKINLGSIVKDLNLQSKKMGTTGLALDKQTGTGLTEYFLSIK